MSLAALLTSAFLAQELHCASQISYFESRGESTYAAKVAPVIVARNRVLSDKFPDTFCEVMTQARQFAFVTNDLHLADPMDRESWETALRAAQDVIAMPVHAYERPMQNALYFHSGNKPNWEWTKLEEVVTIGEHTFYKDKEN